MFICKQPTIQLSLKTKVKFFERHNLASWSNDLLTLLQNLPYTFSLLQYTFAADGGVLIQQRAVILLAEAKGIPSLVFRY